MKVQKVQVDNKPYPIYILLDDNYQIIESVFKYIKFLDNTGKSPNTIKSYCYQLKLFFIYLKEIDKLAENACFEDLVNFVGWLRNPDAYGNICSMVGYEALRSETTVNIVINVVMGFYDYMERLGLFNQTANFYKDTKVKVFKGFLHHIDKYKSGKKNILKLKEKKKLIKVLTHEQISSIAKECNTYRDKLLIRIMYEGGLRIGEVLGLHHEDIVSWDNQIKVIHRNDNPNGAFAKSKRERIVDVSKELIQLYTDYLINEFDENLSCNFVFINLCKINFGMPLRYNSVLDLFRRLRRKTGIELTPHMLRHTHATELLRSGWDIGYIQKRLGHSNVQTTLNTYIHLSNNDMKEKFKEYLANRGANNEPSIAIKSVSEE